MGDEASGSGDVTVQWEMCKNGLLSPSPMKKELRPLHSHITSFLAKFVEVEAPLDSLPDTCSK